MIHGPDGAKLSKRHGALGVEAYRDDMGILPEALENYLLRLGWGHGNVELIARAEAIRLFELKDVGRSPARFDLRKLEAVNAHYLKQADNARLVELVIPRLRRMAGHDISAAQKAVLLQMMDELKPRVKNLDQLAQSAIFLVKARPLAMDDGGKSLLDETGLGYLAVMHRALQSSADWQRQALETAAREVADAHEVGLGKIAGPLRAALTGQKNSPSVFAVMAALGREESLGRMADALEQEDRPARTAPKSGPRGR